MESFQCVSIKGIDFFIVLWDDVDFSVIRIFSAVIKMVSHFNWKLDPRYWQSMKRSTKTSSLFETKNYWYMNSMLAETVYLYGNIIMPKDFTALPSPTLFPPWWHIQHRGGGGGVDPAWHPPYPNLSLKTKINLWIQLALGLHDAWLHMYVIRPPNPGRVAPLVYYCVDTPPLPPTLWPVKAAHVHGRLARGTRDSNQPQTHIKYLM